MKKYFKGSIPFQVASLMPAGLSNCPDKSIPYDPRNSEAIKWLISQPEILSYIFAKCTTSGAIKFDQSTQTWAGINSDAQTAVNNTTATRLPNENHSDSLNS